MAGLLLALINPAAPYWAFGFPSAILTVVGADFVFAGGTLFVAKLALPHEQSLAGGLFQTMAMFGQAFGLSITTIVFDRVRASKSAELGVVAGPDGANAPRPAQLQAYRATSWTIVGFTLFGTSEKMVLRFCTDIPVAALLAVVFLRGVGILGGAHPPEEQRQEEASQNTAIEE